MEKNLSTISLLRYGDVERLVVVRHKETAGINGVPPIKRRTRNMDVVQKQCP
jgi:hypothetical protein